MFRNIIIFIEANFQFGHFDIVNAFEGIQSHLIASERSEEKRWM